MDVKTVSIDSIKPYPNNPRLNDNAVDKVANSIKEFGFQQPIVVDKVGVVIVGHTRLKAAKKLGLKEVPVVYATNLSEEKANAYRLADNKTGEFAEWDDIKLEDELNLITDIDMTDFGFEDTDIETYHDDSSEIPSGVISEKFGITPCSVLNGTKAEWLNRKRKWLSLGIDSEVGRENGITFDVRLAQKAGMDNLVGKSTSLFDPVLAELMYRWFIPKSGGYVYDPFAGGSVRGIVAQQLGYNYTGIDLREEQINANYRCAKKLNADNINWICDDSLNVDKYLEDESQDFVLACPPYMDLEVYSDKEQDLSTMDEKEFTEVYTQILQKAVNKLKPERFAVIVVSDVRRKGKDTSYKDLVGITTNAMASAGAKLYNDMIKVGQIGSKALTIKRSMKTRKVARNHENVLVYFKGDTSKIKGIFPEITDMDFTVEE